MKNNLENAPVAPFSSSYSSQLPELMSKLNISLAISTYQAGKVVTISPKDEDSIVMLPRTFDKPMGIHIEDDTIIVACKDEVIVLENSVELAKAYPNKPNTYDALYSPITTHHTGQVDMHDIAMGKDGIWAINSSFSCLCLIGGKHHFTPKWKPSFISELVSEDRCHLNGLAMKNGQPKYVTALGTGNTPQSWREDIVAGGVLIDIETDEVLFDKLPMPHSPMIYKDELYCLLSASGQFVKLNTETKEIEVIKELDGFCRGLDIIADYAFIGMSKLRKNSSTFAKLPFAEKATKAGIIIVHIPTKAIVGELTYQTSVDEIYDLKILKGTTRPNILNTINPVYKNALSIPGKTFWATTEKSN